VENISVVPEIKIAFDGYQEDYDGIEDLNEQSFAVYIHRCSPGITEQYRKTVLTEGRLSEAQILSFYQSADLEK
jgi:hypothetical protein